MPPTFIHQGTTYRHGDIVEIDLTEHPRIEEASMTGRLILEKSNNNIWHAYVVATERPLPGQKNGGSSPTRSGRTDEERIYPAYEQQLQEHDVPRFKFYDSWHIGNITRTTSDTNVWMLRDPDIRTMRMVTLREHAVESLEHLITNREPVPLHRNGQNIKTLTTTR